MSVLYSTLCLQLIHTHTNVQLDVAVGEISACERIEAVCEGGKCVQNGQGQDRMEKEKSFPFIFLDNM